MVQIVKYIVAGLGILLLNPTKTLAQDSFFKKLKPSISYVAIDGWKADSGGLKFSNNDGSAVGVGLKYPLRDSTLYFQFTYQRANIYSVDLRQNYGVSNFILDFGKSFRISPRSTLNPSIGLAVLRYPAYFSIGFDRMNVTHEFTRFLGFGSMKVGLDYLHDIGNGLQVGGSINAFRSFSYKVFEIGSTTFSLIVQIGL